MEVPDATATGDEYVLVFIGSPDCIASDDPAVHRAVRQILEDVEQQANDSRLGTHTVGVSSNTIGDAGVKYLASIADFDEVLAGGSSSNAGLRYYTTGHLRGAAVTPQLIILRRYGGGQARAEELLVRRFGSAAILQLASDGAQITETAP